MGIYPTEKYDRAGNMLYRTYNDFSGVIKTEVFQLIVSHEIRTDCFCCSCGEREGDDAACRNHGYYGKRPCEEHNMPGSTWDTIDGEDSGEMPKSVQVIRRRQEETRKSVAP